MLLSREVRFAVTPDYQDQISNSWSGWPSTNLLVPRLTLVTVIAGQPEPDSGYICNIKLIDDLVRSVIKNDLIPGFDPKQPAEQMLQHVFQLCSDRWDCPGVTIVSQTLAVTPFLKFTINKNKDSLMLNVTQQFEFSASHRLHNPALSDEENRQLFGKCNNPNGHGHNYVIEVSLHRPVEPSGDGIDLPNFEATVKKLVIDRLDHKHLNQDVDYFSEVNPSVENIAIAIWSWLDGQLGDDKLANIRVYETPKTWADYQG